MERNLFDALKRRRSYYVLTPESPVSDQEIENVVETVLTHVPSAFNSQTARLVLLLGESHTQLWNIVKETLRKMVSAEQFVKTEQKIDQSFASGYGTVLFFEDTALVEKLQAAFAAYKDNFPLWSLQASGMHQIITWVKLEDLGFGASLQHYNPLIDEEVAKTWNLPSSWKLLAQMPFGIPTDKPGDKEIKPLSDRLKVFK